MAAHPERLLQHVRALVPGLCTDQATDAELLDRFIRDNDEDAFAVLVTRHGPMVQGVCRRVLCDSGAAEDVAQAVFLVLARKARSIRRPETLAVWLHQTARHLALKYRRDDARRRTWETRSYRASPARTIRDPLDELSARELLAIFDEEIQHLPEQYRLPLILCGLEGCSQEEVAGRLGWTPGAVKGRLERGRSRLHDRLVRRGLTLSAALAALETGRGVTSAAGFIGATTRAALLFTARAGAADAGLKREVIAIAEEALRSAILPRSKIVLTLLLVVGVLTAGVTALTHQGQGEKQPAEKQTQAAEQPAEQPRALIDRHGDPLPAGALARLGTLRWRAGGTIHDLAFAPDGKTVAAGSRAGIYLFDMDGRPIKHIRPPGNSLFNVAFERIAFSPDGRRLACLCRVWEPGEHGMAVQIWDLTSGRRTHQFREVESLHWLGWSAEGEPLAVLLDKEEILFRELATGKVRRFEARDVRFSSTSFGSCAYAPRAKLLAVPNRRGIINVWDVSTGKKHCVLETKSQFAYSLALSADGRWLASLVSLGRNKSMAQLWDLASGKVIQTVAADQGYLMRVAFAPDGKTLATVSRGAIRFHEVSTGRERGRTQVKAFIAHNVAFSPDSKTLATVENNSSTIRLWDVGSAALKPSFVGHAGYPTRVAFSPDGRRVITRSEHDESMLFWDPTTGEALVPVLRGDRSQGCEFSADGRELFSFPNSKSLEFSDSATGRVLSTVNLADPDRPDLSLLSRDICLSDDGKTLVVLSECHSRNANEPVKDPVLITGWDVATRKQLFRRRRGEFIFHAVSPNLKLLALEPVVGTGELGGPVGGAVRIEDLETGQFLLSLANIKGQPSQLAFSSDSRFLVTNTVGTGSVGDCMLRLWELESAREVLAFPAEDTLNPMVAFSSDGRLMALPGAAREILVWDLRRGRAWQRFKGFDAKVRCLAFSPDGHRLISGLSDNTLLVWQVAAERKADKPAGLDAHGAARAWADLAGDARRAFAARGALVLAPESAVPLLKEHLKPVLAADPTPLHRLLAELDSDNFAVREKARKELAELGDRAAPALEEAMKKKPSLETHRRIEALLQRLRPPVTEPERLRALRAIAVLEDIGSPEARKVLETLAKGVAAARLTRDAKAALARLARRTASEW